jgi:hypothetical protein
VRHQHTDVQSLQQTTMDDVQKSDRTLKPFSEIPGPKGLPFVGTLWDYIKPKGFGFHKLFEAGHFKCISAKF